MLKRNRVSNSIGRFIIRGLTLGGYSILFLWVVGTLFAVGWVIFTSFKTNRELFQNVWSLPESLRWENYVTAWTVGRIADYFLNSIFVTVVSVATVVLVSAMAAYALSRFEFRGNTLLLFTFIAGLAVPLQLLLIPLSFLLRDLHLLDTRIGLIIVYIAVLIPFDTFILTGFFKSLPVAIEEAAILDGCSDFGVFWRIALPLAYPGIIKVAIFNFINNWNEYLLALCFIISPKNRTLPLGIYNLKVAMEQTMDWVVLFAGLVILMLPAFIFYLLFRKRIATGLTAGALKQ